MRDHRFALSKPAAGAEEPPSWLRKTASLLWDNLATLVLLNLVSSLIAAPLVLLGLIAGFLPLLLAVAITLPALLGGLMAAVSGEWRQLPGTMRQRFISTIRQRWLALLPLGGLAAVVTGASIITTSQVLTAPSRPLFLLWVAQSAFLVIAVMLLIYALPLVAAYELGPRLALRNALVLAIATPLPTLGILALLVLLTVLLVWFGLGLWLIVPVVIATFVATNCDHQVERLQEKSNQP